jgi:hypothetical protein
VDGAVEARVLVERVVDAIHAEEGAEADVVERLVEVAFPLPGALILRLVVRVLARGKRLPRLPHRELLERLARALHQEDVRREIVAPVRRLTAERFLHALHRLPLQFFPIHR